MLLPAATGFTTALEENVFGSLRAEASRSAVDRKAPGFQLFGINCYQCIAWSTETGIRRRRGSLFSGKDRALSPAD